MNNLNVGLNSPDISLGIIFIFLAYNFSGISENPLGLIEGDRNRTEEKCNLGLGWSFSADFQMLSTSLVGSGGCSLRHNPVKVAVDRRQTADQC
ncbi:hypothetical protein [Tolypothrix sp. VBCCA 56010]|uniref:hypothetical protein n=1 Tax=Tolypothrix sp. VBCCA 56010 TaxID=3137731 RepID=UPI003D7CB7A6